MIRSLRFLLAAVGALLSTLAWSPPVHAQGSWAMSGAACVSTALKEDDVSWPSDASWEGMGISSGHDVSGDAWAAKCFEVTLCRPRIMRFRINDLDKRPGHNFELWIDGQMIGATPKLGTWGMLVCKKGKYMTTLSNGDWKIGFGRGDGVDVQLPHTAGQVHQIRLRFGGYDGHSAQEVHDSCMTLPNCEFKWDWVIPKVVAKGRLSYSDQNYGSSVGMRSIKLQLYDKNSDGSFRPLDAQTTTDAGGYFTFPCVDNVDTDGTMLDLMVRAFIESDSSDFQLVKPVTMLNKDRYLWSFDTQTKQDCVGITADHSILDFGTQKCTDYNRTTALHIYTALLKGWDWVFARTSGGANPQLMNQTWAIWDYEYGAKTQTVGDTILVCGIASRNTFKPDEWDDDALLHEYGHRVAARYGFRGNATIQSHDGRHQILDLSGNPSPEGAWNEGWAYFFGRVAGHLPPSPVVGPNLQDWGWDRLDPMTRSKENVNLETGFLRVDNPFPTYPPTETGTYYNQGATWEYPVASALWDIYDDQYKNDNQPGPSGTTCGESYWEDANHTLIFAACRSSTTPVHDIYSFYHAYIEQNPDPTVATKLQELFCDHGIDVTQHAPGQIAEDPPGPVGATLGFVDALFPGRPNPFRLGTTIDFSLAAPARVDLRVYDVRGRLVQTLIRGAKRDAGRYSVPWDGRDLEGNAVRAGVYLYRLWTDGFRAEKKLIVMP